MEEANEVLKKAKTILIEQDVTKLTFSEFLQKLNVTEDHYHQCLGTMKKGYKVILKRDTKEIWINNYNEEMLRAWNANMDIQLAYDSHAVVTYICDYAYKTENGMTKKLKKALDLARDKEDLEQLRILVNEYLTSRQKAAPEAIYCLFKHMRLKNANLSTKFVIAGFSENRDVMMDPASKEHEENIEFSEQIELNTS